MTFRCGKHAGDRDIRIGARWGSHTSLAPFSLWRYSGRESGRAIGDAMKTVKHQRNRIVASSLVYTLFVLAVPLVKGAGWTARGATLVSVPLFVYAYGSFFRDSTTRRAVV